MGILHWSEMGQMPEGSCNIYLHILDIVMVLRAKSVILIIYFLKVYYIL